MECPHCHRQTSPSSKHCKRCGGAIPSSQHLLEEAGIVESSTHVASSAPSPAPTRNSARYRLARLGDRFIAFALDTALLFGLFTVADAWVFMRFGWVDGNELQLTTAALLIAITLNAAILFLYGWLLEAGWGATLGKAMVGIRVVSTTEHSSVSASAVRNLLRILDGLGFYLVGTVVAACSNIRQRIGDICAQTAVVEQSFGIGIRLTAIVLWMATLVGAGWTVPRICSANDPIHTPYLGQVLVRVGRSGNSAYLRIARFTADVQLASTTPQPQPPASNR